MFTIEPSVRIDDPEAAVNRRRSGTVVGLASVAKMDKATGFYPVDCRFESCRGRYYETVNTTVAAVPMIGAASVTRICSPVRRLIMRNSC